jgi:protein-disulfide isomerase
MKIQQLLPVVLLLCLSAVAQDVPAALRPPKGSSVALVVFEDLQCPQCRHTAPLVAQASQTYKIPVIRHDFPLPMHNWSYQAAVLARFFDTTSKTVGNAFRDYIFEHQLEILPDNLQSFAEKFASEHKIQMPFVVDPSGKLAALVNADRDLGKTIGINHTPTIYVVSDKKTAKPYVEVTDPNNQLYALIDSVKKQ